MSFFKRLWSYFRPGPVVVTEAPPAAGALQRGQVDHVVILDGTMSSLRRGYETNAGLTFKLLTEGGRNRQRTVYYEPGVQFEDWRHLAAVAQGRGINRQILRAYGYLASRYRPGDRIFLIGYSRGAYAVRSLAGVIDRIGLLQRDHATERNLRLAFRHYRRDPDRVAARAFARRFCHARTPIEAVGVWDTVKALGIRLPLLWMLTEGNHRFHNHQLGSGIRHGFHALALDETRVAFQPVLWDCPPDWHGNVEQVWFRGAHADIGGQVGWKPRARPLSHIPLVWMLDRMESCGLALPPGWKDRFPCDASAPMVGTWRGWGALFLLRRRRIVGRDRSERLHPTALSPKQGPVTVVDPE
ncbi:DUF2235 domain-containing protein [Szabonella alba]|uniref:DUF2235 domain-containing protein n=1 Tax=Szabonella alba TaxID=2804194 RepID=UPI003B585C7D